MWRNSEVRWGAVSQTFHWLSLLLVLGLLVVGFVAHDVESISTRFTLMQWHKSFGVLLLTLTVLRLLWLHMGPRPPLPDALKPWERAAVHISHIGLYVLLLVMPIIGWLSVSTSTKGIPTEIFSLFTLPHLMQPDDGLHELFEEIHEILAFVLMGFIAVHAAAAIKHHVILKNDVLRRMLPWGGK